jgi:hypothetical protein
MSTPGHGVGESPGTTSPDFNLRFRIQSRPDISVPGIRKLFQAVFHSLAQ